MTNKDVPWGEAGRRVRVQDRDEPAVLDSKDVTMMRASASGELQLAWASAHAQPLRGKRCSGRAEAPLWLGTESGEVVAPFVLAGEESPARPLLDD